MKHRAGLDCKRPYSVDFRSGDDAEGCWVEDGTHVRQVAGNSGIYLVITDLATGEIVRDDRPWQMRQGAS